LNGRAPARGVVFTEDFLKIADQQGRDALGHGRSPKALGKLSEPSLPAHDPMKEYCQRRELLHAFEFSSLRVTPGWPRKVPSEDPLDQFVAKALGQWSQARQEVVRMNEAAVRQRATTGK